MLSVTPTAVRRGLGSLARYLWANGRERFVPVLDRASTRVQLEAPLLDAVLARLDPTLSLSAVRAEVVRVVDETHDTKTYWLRPNARFGHFRPGAFVNLKLRIKGRDVQRSYSLSSPPTAAEGLVSLTVKRVASGLVSNWLADNVRPGDVLTLSSPQGYFVLPERVPPRLLMLSAGSGITPVMAMLQQLVAAGSSSEVVFLHFARSPEDVIFGEELRRIAARHPNITVVVCVESAPDTWQGPTGRFSEALLARHAPDFRELDTFMCGPSGFMQAVMGCLEQANADLSKLRYERFSVELDPAQFLDHAHVIRFARSGTQSVSNRPRTILEEAELAGLDVPSGCRAGNCGTCRSRKKHGVVLDLTTGIESGPDADFIYPCVCVARGPVEMDL
jgi:ferredoxin-NADP reductase